MVQLTESMLRYTLLFDGQWIQNKLFVLLK